MARILCLAPSGFGKTTGTGKINMPDLGIVFEGLPNESSYIVSKTSKPLPYPDQAKQWPLTTIDNLKGGRRVICNTPTEALLVLNELLSAPPIKNVVLDDFNYYMQDWYMDNALRSGWDAPKQIGFDTGKLFKVFEKFDGVDKNIIILAHGENVPVPGGRTYTKLKTTGKMVDEYVTPEGKFDVVLVGTSKYDGIAKKAVKQYVTNENEDFSSPKSPIGMFKDMYVSNDLGPIIKTVNAYYKGE